MSLGVGLALMTAVLWALSPMFMASVGRRIGAHPTNLLRLLIAGTFFVGIVLPVYLLAPGEVAWPTARQWLWLILSGWVGMVAGDACFYEALVLLGPRRAIKVNTIAPVVALAVGWLWQNETLTGRGLLGAGLVIGAVTYTAFTEATRGGAARRGEDRDGSNREGEAPSEPRLAAPGDPGSHGGSPSQSSEANPQHTTAERLVLCYQTVADDPAVPPRRSEPGQMSPLGLAFGVASAVCIALGAVFARKAYLMPASDGRPLDAVVATVIRVGASAAVFWLLPVFTGTIGSTVAHLADRSVRRRMLVGTAFGAIGGMLCYVAALRHAPAGLVSTLVSTSTLVVIPLTAVRYHTRIPWDVTAAATVAVIGVALISWK
jgi:drug/metabolite transporter (DMT)-like permease